MPEQNQAHDAEAHETNVQAADTATIDLIFSRTLQSNYRTDTFL